MSAQTFSITLRANEQITIEIKHLSTKKRNFKDWLGWKNKTLYDWLTLLSSILLPFAIAIFTITLTIRENNEQRDMREHDLKIAALRRAQNRNIAEQQGNETILSNFLKDVSNLILKYQYHLNDHRARLTASSMAIIALQQLNTEKKQFIIGYLYRMTFINQLETDHPFILQGVDLSNLQLTNQLLPKQPSKKSFHGLYLPYVYLTNATFTHMKMQYVNFDHSHLAGVNFTYSTLQYGDFQSAQLQDCDFYGADLTDVDFRDTNLTGANINDEQLRKAAFLNHVIFPNGSLFLYEEHDFNVLSMKNWNYNGTFEQKNFFNHSIIINEKNKIIISQDIFPENYVKRYWIDRERLTYTLSTVIYGTNITIQILFYNSNGRLLRIDQLSNLLDFEFVFQTEKKRFVSLDQSTTIKKYHETSGLCRRNTYLLRVEILIQPTKENFFIEYIHLNLTSQFNIQH